MTAYAILYRALNADSRMTPYAGLFSAESAQEAERQCRHVHGAKPGFTILHIAPLLESG